MSFIRRKFIHGNWYLYLVHSERRGSKVFQIVDEYLGPEEPKELEIREIEYYRERQRLVVPNSIKK